jgi:membrane-bound lytic murein transglycosylase A
LRAIHDPPIQTGCSSQRAAAKPTLTAAWARRPAALAIIGLLAVLLGRDSLVRFGIFPVGFDRLSGWADDRVSAAVPAFLKSCARFLPRGDMAAFDPTAKSANFGRVGDWRALCEAAEALPVGDDNAARRFFEAGFVPFAVGDYGETEGLFTGYYEIELNGSRRKHGRYQTPIYRRPPELNSGPRPVRAEIEDGTLAGRGLELLWVDDPIDAFFLQIQGSGRVRLSGGGTVRVGYDGQNGHPYVAVGRLLIDRGMIPRDKLTMTTIRTWMKQYPEAGAALRRENPSYVFFREIRGDGPIGAEGAVLTPARAMAVDRAFIGLGIPAWLEAEERFAQAESVRRLVVAQDTGGAIKGPVRGDVFWGTGSAAADRAGVMNARGRYYLLLPRAIGEHLVPGQLPSRGPD